MLSAFREFTDDALALSEQSSKSLLTCHFGGIVSWKWGRRPYGLVCAVYFTDSHVAKFTYVR